MSWWRSPENCPSLVGDLNNIQVVTQYGKSFHDEVFAANSPAPQLFQADANPLACLHLNHKGFVRLLKNYFLIRPCGDFTMQAEKVNFFPAGWAAGMPLKYLSAAVCFANLPFPHAGDQLAIFAGHDAVAWFTGEIKGAKAGASCGPLGAFSGAAKPYFKSLVYKINTL